MRNVLGYTILISIGVSLSACSVRPSLPLEKHVYRVENADSARIGDVGYKKKSSVIGWIYGNHASAYVHVSEIKVPEDIIRKDFSGSNKEELSKIMDVHKSAYINEVVMKSTTESHAEYTSYTVDQIKLLNILNSSNADDHTKSIMDMIRRDRESRIITSVVLVTNHTAASKGEYSAKSMVVNGSYESKKATKIGDYVVVGYEMSRACWDERGNIAKLSLDSFGEEDRACPPGLSTSASVRTE